MLIEIENLEKGFGGRNVLEDVTLRLAPGEVLALAGANGAGKTTTIHLLMGFLERTGGEIRVLGKEPESRAHLGLVGWLSERPVFPPELRIDELVAMQRRAYGSWDSKLAADLQDRLALPSAARAGTLSRGQLGRLSLLLALPARPRLLLLDDPTLGLDPAARRLLLGELLALAAEDGTGILLSTHLLNEVDRALDRLAVLHRGRIVLDEPVEGLRRDWRRLVMHGDGSPPEGLDVFEAPDGSWLCRRWDPGAWAGEARPLDLEEIFSAVTGGDS